MFWRSHPVIALGVVLRVRVDIIGRGAIVLSRFRLMGLRARNTPRRYADRTTAIQPRANPPPRRG